MTHSHTESKVSDLIASESVLAALRLDAFASWLRAQSETRSYGGGLATKTCPIACYVGFRVASYIYGMPLWASKFINRFDALSEPTQRAALEALAGVEFDALSDEDVSK